MKGLPYNFIPEDDETEVVEVLAVVLVHVHPVHVHQDVPDRNEELDINLNGTVIYRILIKVGVGISRL